MEPSNPGKPQVLRLSTNGLTCLREERVRRDGDPRRAASTNGRMLMGHRRGRKTGQNFRPGLIPIGGAAMPGRPPAPRTPRSGGAAVERRWAPRGADGPGDRLGTGCSRQSRHGQRGLSQHAASGRSGHLAPAGTGRARSGTGRGCASTTVAHTAAPVGVTLIDPRLTWPEVTYKAFRQQ